MESLAQMGVQLLLFTLGLEFSLSKLRVVRNVALLGTSHLDAWVFKDKPPICVVLCCGDAIISIFLEVPTPPALMCSVDRLDVSPREYVGGCGFICELVTCNPSLWDSAQLLLTQVCAAIAMQPGPVLLWQAAWWRSFCSSLHRGS